jgi:hypothetical protein
MFDFCHFVAYCGTKWKNRGYVTSLMTGSLIFTIKTIKRLCGAAFHTPTFIGCGFSELHIL